MDSCGYLPQIGTTDAINQSAYPNSALHHHCEEDEHVPQLLRLSALQRVYLEQSGDINDDIIQAVRLFWEECTKDMVPGVTNKLHRHAECWWKLYQDTAAWEHYERAFIRLEVISALNGHRCVTIDAANALKYETESVRIVVQCTHCDVPHNISRTLNQAGFLFQRKYNSKEEISAVLIPLGGASHLCGTGYCRVSSHKRLESTYENNARIKCHRASTLHEHSSPVARHSLIDVVDAGEAPSCICEPRCMTSRGQTILEATGIEFTSRFLTRSTSGDLLGTVAVGESFKTIKDSVQTVVLADKVAQALEQKQTHAAFKRLLKRRNTFESELKRSRKPVIDPVWKTATSKLYGCHFCFLKKENWKDSITWASRKFFSKHMHEAHPEVMTPELAIEITRLQPYRCTMEDCNFATEGRKGLKDHMLKCVRRKRN